MRLISRLQQRLQWSRRRYIAALAALWLVADVASSFYQVYKPLPQGINYQSPIVQADVEFLGDYTFLNQNEQQHAKQQIFSQMLRMIDEAQSTIVLDMFLFNAEVGQSQRTHQQLSRQLTDALIAKKRANPTLSISVITDPINTVYGGMLPQHLQQLRQHGIALTFTDLHDLRASNPLWSGWWYLCCQSLGNDPEGGWLPNPLGKQPITIRSYLELLNFKANHRKIVIADSAQGWRTLVSSANPHDGSDRNANVAMRIDGKLAQYALQSEHAVAAMSRGDVPLLVMSAQPQQQQQPYVQLLTEGRIYREVLNAINQLQRGERLDLMMFYLSERQIIEALKAAQARGAQLRILLDPNKDAFGRQKNGIPNRPVAAELHHANIPVRWCLTNGEQCHSKMLILSKRDGRKQIILGSANYTTRNLKNYNLESNISVIARADYPAMTAAQQYFDNAWSNLEHLISVDYARFADESRFKYAAYRIMEWSGLSTF